MASTVPGRGPGPAGGGSAATEAESKDAVKKPDNKRVSLFINRSSYGTDTVCRAAPISNCVSDYARALMQFDLGLWSVATADRTT